MPIHSGLKTNAYRHHLAWKSTVHTEAKTLCPDMDWDARHGGTTSFLPLGLYSLNEISTDDEWAKATSHRAINRKSRGTLLVPALEYSETATAAQIATIKDTHKTRKTVIEAGTTALKELTVQVYESLPEEMKQDYARRPDAFRTVRDYIADVSDRYSLMRKEALKKLEADFLIPIGSDEDPLTFANKHEAYLASLPTHRQREYPPSRCIDLLLDALREEPEVRRDVRKAIAHAHPDEATRTWATVKAIYVKQTREERQEQRILHGSAHAFHACLTTSTPLTNPVEHSAIDAAANAATADPPVTMSMLKTALGELKFGGEGRGDGRGRGNGRDNRNATSGGVKAPTIPHGAKGTPWCFYHHDFGTHNTEDCTYCQRRYPKADYPGIYRASAPCTSHGIQSGGGAARKGGRY